MTITYHPELIQGQIPAVIDRDKLMGRLYYDKDSGLFTWRAPPLNHLRLLGTVAGSKNNGYITIKIECQRFLAHRLAWLYVYGTLPSCVIDHIDADPSNNAILNLRLATQAQNCANARPWADKAQPKGVRKVRGRYLARISFERGLRTIGWFTTPDEAGAAYLKEAKRLYGEFARAE